MYPPSGSNLRSFNITYADNSVFETGDEGITCIPNIEFGFAHNIIYNPDPGYNGILGLGLNSGSLSFATQIGQKFSYFIGSLTDKYYNYNQLILGEGANLEGYTTPFQVHHGFNYVTMEGISIGENNLDIALGIFEMKKNGTGGVIIDTGSTLTYLVDDVYKPLCKEVRNLFRGSFREVRIRNFPWLLCYFGSVSRDLIGFPVVTFHFAGGADLVLDSLSFFQQMGDHLFCMSIDLSVIGLLAQQSYNVGYDLVNGFIYFKELIVNFLVANGYYGCIQNSFPKIS